MFRYSLISLEFMEADILNNGRSNFPIIPLMTKK